MYKKIQETIKNLKDDHIVGVRIKNNQDPTMLEDMMSMLSSRLTYLGLGGSSMVFW